MRECYLFAGPSLSPPALASALAQGISILPPVTRGDVFGLTAKRQPATMILADGRFHDAMSVGHAELRHALERSWEVWGLSSMGAIRAYELRSFGMRGYGRIYRMFCRYRDFQDDEVALLHSAEPPYRPASEPLVHLRAALADFVRRRIVTSRRAAQVVCALKQLWYGDRTLALFEDLITRGLNARNRQRVHAATARFDRYRIKQEDLAAFLAARSLLHVHGASPD